MKLTFLKQIEQIRSIQQFCVAKERFTPVVQEFLKFPSWNFNDSFSVHQKFGEICFKELPTTTEGTSQNFRKFLNSLLPATLFFDRNNRRSVPAIFFTLQTSVKEFFKNWIATGLGKWFLRVIRAPRFQLYISQKL